MKKFSEWLDESNAVHIRAIRLGYLARNKIVAGYWVEIMSKAKNAYYSGSPIMDDKTYDHFENNLKILDPENPFLEKVGTINDNN